MPIDLTKDEVVMLRWLLDGLEVHGQPFKDFEDDTGRDDIDPEQLVKSVLAKIAKASPS